MAVVPELHVDGGQVDQGPGGVVLQPGRDRHLERLLQVGPAALVADLQPSRADVVQGVGEGLPVAQPPGQLDRPRPPCQRRLGPVGQHVQLRLVAVGHGQLVAGLAMLEHGDGPGGGRLRLLPAAGPPGQARQPAQALAELLGAAAFRLPDAQRRLPGLQRLLGQPDR
jgi:hypothetical protein